MQITEKQVGNLSLAIQGVGTVFVAIFLAAYLGGLPSTNILHSEPAFRIPLIVFGATLLILILVSLILVAYLRNNKILVNARSKAISQQKIQTAIKLAILTITVAYFLFNLHTMATLEWIGEWARTPGRINTIQLIEDINATVGNSFRMAGSVIAIAALIYYFVKKGISKNRGFLFLRVVLVFEAIYWFGLLASGASGIFRVLSSSRGLTYSLGYALPAVLESTIVPIVLLVLAYKLSPNKPMKNPIKWGLISGTVLVFVYWLLNTGIWALTLPSYKGTGSSESVIKGTQYLTTYPYMMVAFLSTAVGLLALTLYAVYATKKLSGTENLQSLNLRPVGIIILGLGLFYLWNYLTWIFFGGDHVWSSWFAWLLGHNMDLWMLSFSLIGIPLLFFNTVEKQNDFIDRKWSENYSNKEYNKD
jgi:hypothetical protein